MTTITQKPDKAVPSWKRLVRSALLCLAAGSLFLVIAYIDYVTGTEISLSIFYLVPILVVAWLTNLGTAVLISILGTILWYLVDITIGEHTYVHPAAAYWNIVVRLGFFLVASLTVASLGRNLRLLKTRTGQLMRAYKTLDDTRKEQLIMRDNLMSHVSHELRTPLAALHQFVTLVNDGIAGELNAEQKEYLGIAIKNVRQLDRMISDLLDSTRAEAGKLRLVRTDVSVTDMVEETIQCLRLSAEAKQLKLSSSIEQDLPPVYADPTRLRQVLMNFLDNAMKFTPAGGQIALRARSWDRKPGYLHVSVTDNGPGISEEAKKMLFHRYFQAGKDSDKASRKGLGLGLYISKEIISIHGGEIWAESEPGKGSAFSFAVPFQPGVRQDQSAKEG